jgi:hypothetical protein
MLTKLTGGLLGALIVYVVWQVRQAKARGRLREIDEGKRCIACDRTNLAVDNGQARCLACGHTVMLEALQATKLSASEIADVTRPDESRGGLFR